VWVHVEALELAIAGRQAFGAAGSGPGGGSGGLSAVGVLCLFKHTIQ
jgi:hypothetical protein